MRARAWILLGVLAVAAGLTVAEDRTGAVPANVTGFVILLAISLVFSLLPFWSRLPALPPMPGLFETPGAGRWCSACGHPAPRQRACPSCHSPAPALRAKRSLRPTRPSAGPANGPAKAQTGAGTAEGVQRKGKP